MKKNPSQKTHIEKTQAGTKSIGFDFQYYFFLWKVLSLNPGESVGLELKDDVHTELNDDIQIYFQIKHTTQKRKDGRGINMTSNDEDMWKTIYNWSLVIRDENDNRKEKQAQLDFLSKSYFVLWSNKGSTADNEFIKHLKKFQNQEIDLQLFIHEINEFSTKTTNEKLKNYAASLLSLNNVVLYEFLQRITFDLEKDEIIEKCHQAILAKMIEQEEVEDVFSKIDSRIRKENFIKIKAGEKMQITFEEFHTKFRKYFGTSRSGRLQVKDFTSELPIRLEEQIFVKQLIEIKDVEQSDLEIIAEYTRYKLKLYNNLSEWHKKGYLTAEEIENYHRDAILKWRNKFRSTFRGRKEGEEDESLSQKLVDTFRETKLEMDGQFLETELCNGEYYYLSDLPEIGWRMDWEKYRK
ncbi:ABC-three component system protein [Salinimicrobium sp. TIG7-5_MAKvit]|uniref:ABC-three component system protein n=1 Tax=Salinimicrobium sp. TIG7-5_MAKvit TaxID=3121289 RepID=UPI003C6E52C8